MFANDLFGGTNEDQQRLDPKCWKGYKKQGTKMKGGVRVNNCVPANEESADAGITKDKETKFHAKLDRLVHDTFGKRDVEKTAKEGRDWDEGNSEPANNFAITINGRQWKVFSGMGHYADDERERAQYAKLKDWARKKSQETGKQWEVHVTGAPATESVAEGSAGAKYKIKSIGKDKNGDYYISPNTDKKVYKQAKVGDHETPSGEVKPKVGMPYKESVQLEEGLIQKLAAGALGLALSMGVGAKELAVYHDAATDKLRVAKSVDKIPADALMKFVVDTDKKTVRMIDDSGDAKPVEVKPRTAVAARNVTKAEPAPVTKAEPKVIPEPGLSKFSLKNGKIKFGMSKEEYDQVAKEDSSGETYGSGYVKIAGHLIYPTFDKSNKLESFSFNFAGDPNLQDLEIQKLVGIFNDRYGKPKSVLKLDDGRIFSMEWEVQDAVISVTPVQWNPKTNRFAGDGFVWIKSKSAVERDRKTQQDRDAKAKKDFNESYELQVRLMEMRLAGYQI